MIDLNVALLDFVVRGGTPDAQRFIARYAASVPHYPGVHGLSVTFHPGFTLAQLAWVAQLPHTQLHYATVAELRSALAQIGYEPVLIRTPNPANPDHCTLGVAVQGGTTLPSLPQDAAQALASAFHVTLNPYQPKP